MLAGKTGPPGLGCIRAPISWELAIAAKAPICPARAWPSADTSGVSNEGRRRLSPEAMRERVVIGGLAALGGCGKATLL